MCKHPDKDFLCNCFESGKKVVIGHDYGAAVWIQPVIIDDVEKITSCDVHEVGMEISIELDFFKYKLLPVFMDFFDPKLEVNKKRYTTGFKDEGEFLTCFMSECLEPNFFTYDHIKMISDTLRGIAGDDGRSITEIAKLLDEVMNSSPETEYICVMS